MTLIGVAGILAYYARNSLNEILRILYTFSTLFVLFALVSVAASDAIALGVDASILTAFMWLVLVVIIFEFILDFIAVLKPALLMNVRSKLRVT